ncbi:MAG: 50S ribosomal protein L35 [Candidatus Yanofskybacteria bacterium]|nr:50S ribosomal protein L35 [Candidatus Yanofskybacteria bacterium]
MSHKLKTNKSALKRFKIGKNKIMHRRVNQNHFNARDTGEETRSKRGYKQLLGTNEKDMKKILPYS